MLYFHLRLISRCPQHLRLNVLLRMFRHRCWPNVSAVKWKLMLIFIRLGTEPTAFKSLEQPLHFPNLGAYRPSWHLSKVNSYQGSELTTNGSCECVVVPSNIYLKLFTELTDQWNQTILRLLARKAFLFFKKKSKKYHIILFYRSAFKNYDCDESGEKMKIVTHIIRLTNQCFHIKALKRCGWIIKTKISSPSLWRRLLQRTRLFKVDPLS